MHKKDENCESTKTKPGDSENDHMVFKSVAPLEADIKQKQTVKTTHMTVYAKPRQVENLIAQSLQRKNLT